MPHFVRQPTRLPYNYPSRNAARQREAGLSNLRNPRSFKYSLRALEDETSKVGSAYKRFAILIIAATLRSTSASVVAQDETLMRMAVRFCQMVTPHQQVPSS